MTAEAHRETTAVVETRDGRIAGNAAGGIVVFRGIPYARPPLGSDRFRPPAPVAPWAGVRDAQRSGPAAPQIAGPVSRMIGASADRQDEDCLSLNVQTPALPRQGSAGRPVLVWLHGGGFITGSGTLPAYDGAELVRRGDVVVVTLNYRLGALGFLHLPDLDDGATVNLGLLDQLAGLEWVRDNVASFGGDPQNVTLFGQSAGAMCAATLLTIPRARGLFQRAILQSGADRNVHDPETAARVAASFLAELGLAPGAAARLRELPVRALLEAQLRCLVRLRREVADPPFQPCVDGVVLPRSPLEAQAAGDAARIPLLVGTNRDEWKFYGINDPKARSLDAAGLLRRCRRNIPGRDVQGRSLAERVVETYRAAREGRASTEPRELWFAIESDRWFRRPATELCQRHAERQPATWAYLFDWESPALEGALGSCHALEVPFVFGTVAIPGVRDLVGDGPEARRLARCMQDAWLAFARSGRPQSPALGVWPAYESERRATMVLGAACGVAHAPHEAERAIWDEIE